MNFFLDDKPIIACSTGNVTNTAIAVIRISGFNSLDIFKHNFSIDISKIKPRFNHHIELIFSNIVFDDCLLCFFPSSSSYNGENIIELSVHGNILNVDRIINEFVRIHNFRIADPGEFTYRAFRNKKLSLSQVEGLDLFLNSSSLYGLNHGLGLMQGELHRNYELLYDYFMSMKSSVELLIDFSEDVGEEPAKNMFLDSYSKFVDLVESLFVRSSSNISGLISPEIVLVGETNAGKSTIFNSILKFDRSIVSNVRGTTRDYVSENISYNGVNFSIVDTAGIRETYDVVETVGIDRSLKKISEAFFKILVVNPCDFSNEIYNKLPMKNFDLLIFTHEDNKYFFPSLLNFDFDKLNFNFFISCDLLSGSIGPIENSGSIGPTENSGSIGPAENSGSIGPAENSGSIGPVEKSGSIGTTILELAHKKYADISKNSPILIHRHRLKIAELHNLTKSDICNSQDFNDMAILSYKINRLGVCMSELIGQISDDDVLNSIFSNFCIGK